MAKFMYNKDGAKIFKEGEKIPAGYVDSPAKVGKEKPVKVEKKVKKDAE